MRLDRLFESPQERADDCEMDLTQRFAQLPTAPEKIAMYTLTNEPGYGPRTGYNGYSGYSGDT